MKPFQFNLTTLAARSTLIVLLLSASAGLASAQTTFYVDDDAPSDPGPFNPFVSDPSEAGTLGNPFDRIQEAIDAASDGDEVLILDGQYFDFSTIDLSSGLGSAKSLWIHSAGGPAVTIVDAPGLPARIMRATSGEDASTILEGLTLRGGSATAAAPNDRGAGLYVNLSSPTVIDCIFDSNDAQFGGGVYSNAGFPSFTGCLMLNNTASSGAGIYINGTVTLERCSFENNSATIDGGGMFASGLIIVRDSTFSGNFAGSQGGGIHQFTSSPTLTVERTLFLSNDSNSWGAGIHCTQTLVVRDCVFNSNRCINSFSGGGIGVTASGFYSASGSTFVNNTGYAVRISSGSGSIQNSILWGNNPAELLAGNPTSVRYSDVLGSWNGIGNLDLDPLFENINGSDGIPGTQDDDLRLFQDSPCIDSGDTVVVSSLAPGTQYPEGIDGLPRVVDRPESADTGVAVLGLTVDMGAYEFPEAACVPGNRVSRKKF